MPAEIFIELTNSKLSYSAGEVIKGHVVAKNDGSLVAEEATVLLQGKGLLNWTETDFTNNNGISQSYRSEYYYGSETYVNQKLSLVGDQQNVLKSTDGTITYPFEFILPKNCPSSFTSQSGSISYSLEAELRQALQKKTIKATLPITVNAVVDLNLEMDAIKPQKVEKVKDGNVFVFRNGEARFVLKLPKTSGFVPGEMLDVVVEVTNSGCNTNVSGITATFGQVKHYHTRVKSKRAEKILCQVEGPQVEAGNNTIWMPLTIIIPRVPPTHLGGHCKIIDVEYFIAVTLRFPGLSSPISGQLPVFIGTIPLRKTDSSNIVQTSSSTLAAEETTQPIIKN